MKKEKVLLKISGDRGEMRARLKCDGDGQTLGNILFTAITAVIEIGTAQERSTMEVIDLIGQQYIRAMQYTGIDKDFKEFIANKKKAEAQNEKAA